MLTATMGVSLLAACVAPPPPRPYAAYAAQAPARPHQRTVARCAPDRQAITDARKAALFQDFDAWQREHHDPADQAPHPLPAPGPEQRTTAVQACRAKPS